MVERERVGGEGEREREREWRGWGREGRQVLVQYYSIAAKQHLGRSNEPVLRHVSGKSNNQTKQKVILQRLSGPFLYPRY